MSITAKAYQLVAFSGFNVTPQISDENLEDWYNTCIAHGVPIDILNGIAVTKLNIPSINSTNGLSPIGEGYYCPKSNVLFFDGCKQIKDVETGLLCLPLVNTPAKNATSPSDNIIAASVLSKEVTAAFTSGADRVIISDGLLFSCVSSHKSYILDMSVFNVSGETITFPYYSLGNPMTGTIKVDEAGAGVFINPDVSLSCNDSLGQDIHELFSSSPRNIVFLGDVQSRVVINCLDGKRNLYGSSLVSFCNSDTASDDTVLVHDFEKVLASKASLEAFECSVRDRAKKHIVTSNALFAEEILTPVLAKFGSGFVKKHAISILAGFELPRLCDLCKVKEPIKSVSVLHMSFSVEDGFAFKRDRFADCSCLDGYSGKIAVTDVLSFLGVNTRTFVDSYMKSINEVGDSDTYYPLKKDKKIPGVQESVYRSISEGKVSLQDALRAFK